MDNLIRNYNFTSENKKQSRQIIGCVFDWFECRINQVPSISALELFGYSSEQDKGCVTHEHYFETNDFSVSWDIKSTYIQKGWSHFRVKNHIFYSLRGFNSVVEYAEITIRRIFGSNAIPVITRIDFAFDISEKSDFLSVIRSQFRNHTLPGTDKYTHFVGKVGTLRYVNYSAGARGSRLFFRLYHKTIENTDFKNNAPKKQYIADWHRQLFGNDNVIRFEVEYKPSNNTLLSNFVYQHFEEFASKYFGGEDLKLYLGEQYKKNKTYTDRDAKRLIRELDKYFSFKDNTRGLVIGKYFVERYAECFNDDYE